MKDTCSEPGCGRPVRSNGLCNTCYQRHYRHGTLPPGRKTLGPDAHCSAPGCDRAIGHAGAKGLCYKHYLRLKKTGTLDQPARTAPLAERFAAMVSPEPCQCGECDGCLLWTGGINRRTGYGNFSIDDKTYLAHRVAWELTHGQLLNEVTDVDHVYENGCRHRHCVKLGHLEAVPTAVNNKRIVVTDRTRQRRSAAGRKAWTTEVAADAQAEAEILRFLLAHPEGQHLRQISAATTGRTSVTRARLSTLIERGFVRGPTSRYGYRLAEKFKD